MDENIDMTYRFTSDEEPTDEQLLVIMKEVEADVRRENIEFKKKIQENINKEYLRVRTLYPNL